MEKRSSEARLPEACAETRQHPAIMCITVDVNRGAKALHTKGATEMCHGQKGGKGRGSDREEAQTNGGTKEDEPWGEDQGSERGKDQRERLQLYQLHGRDACARRKIGMYTRLLNASPSIKPAIKRPACYIR